MQTFTGFFFLWFFLICSFFALPVSLHIYISPFPFVFLWLSQAHPAHQNLWRWRRWQTAQPSWPGAQAEITAAPSPTTSYRPELLSLWAGRGSTQVGSTEEMLFFYFLHHVGCFTDDSRGPAGRHSCFSLLFNSHLGCAFIIIIWKEYSMIWFH